MTIRRPPFSGDGLDGPGISGRFRGGREDYSWPHRRAAPVRAIFPPSSPDHIIQAAVEDSVLFFFFLLQSYHDVQIVVGSFFLFVICLFAYFTFTASTFAFPDGDPLHQQGKTSLCLPREK